MPDQDKSPEYWKAASQSFDRVAGLYDTYRPSYPPALIEDILQITGIQRQDRILEIGCGTGKATRLFAQRGYTIRCIEPGQNLIAAAAKNLAAYPRVDFIQSRFEDWDSQGELFDLVISAQAYHWVPEAVRYPKTAAVLKPGGFLAVFWNMYPGMGGENREALDEVYRRQAPEIAGPPQAIEVVIESRDKSLRESPFFDQVVVRQYPWAERYDTKSYLGLLNTYSDHLGLPEQKRSALFQAIAELIELNGGVIEKAYLAVLYIARRSAVRVEAI